MIVEPLGIEGAWVYTPRQFEDERGSFLESYQASAFTAATGRSLEVAQVNTSVSRAGVIRGIHFADVPPSQAKYVSCPAGAIWDVVVDLRVGSPTFGAWEGVLLDDVERRSVYLSEGLGHGFIALEDDSTVVYLCSTPYSPGREHGVDPLDRELGITWPTAYRDHEPLPSVLSGKDAAAPSLAQARDLEILPTMAAVRTFLASP